MPSRNLQATAANLAADPAGSRFLGGPAQLSVSWIWENRQAVVVQLQSMTTLPAYLIHTCKLSMKTTPACRFRMPAQIIGPHERNVEFKLECDPDDHMQLRADVPIDTNQWFCEVLPGWSAPLEPDWPVDPNDWFGPGRSDSPS